MLIPETKLRSIIRNILLEQGKISDSETGVGVEISRQQAVDALHWGLAAASIADPTMTADLIDAFIYSLEGDHRSAALVIAGSAGGLLAGAAVVKVANARAAAKAAKESGNISDEAFAALSKSIEDAEKVAREAYQNSRTVKAPAKNPGQSHYVNPARGHRITSSGSSVKAEPGTPRGQGPQRGRSDPRMSSPGQKIQSATKQASQSLPGEKVSLALARKPRAHPAAVPKMLPKSVSDGIYLRLSQGVRSLIEAALRRKAGVRVVFYGKSRGIGIKIGDALDDNAFKELYNNTVKIFPDAKSLWPDQDSFKSFVGEVDIQFFDKNVRARAAMQSGDAGRLRMNSGADVDRLKSLIQRQGAQNGDSFTGDIPDWVYTRLRDDDFTHEFTHHIDKLTGILRAGRSQKAGKLGYSSWVHEINARYIAAIEEVERKLLAGDPDMISLIRDSDPIDFAKAFMDIVDTKRSGGYYEGISALPVEVMAEMIDQILRPGGAHSILRQAI